MAAACPVTAERRAELKLAARAFANLEAGRAVPAAWLTLPGVADWLRTELADVPAAVVARDIDDDGAEWAMVAIRRADLAAESGRWVHLWHGATGNTAATVAWAKQFAAIRGEVCATPHRHSGAEYYMTGSRRGAPFVAAVMTGPAVQVFGSDVWSLTDPITGRRYETRPAGAAWSFHGEAWVVPAEQSMWFATDCPATAAALRAAGHKAHVMTVRGLGQVACRRAPSGVRKPAARPIKMRGVGAADLED